MSLYSNRLTFILSFWAMAQLDGVLSRPLLWKNFLFNTGLHRLNKTLCNFFIWFVRITNNDQQTQRMIRYFCVILFGSILGRIEWVASTFLVHFKYNNPNMFHQLFVKTGWPVVTMLIHSLVTIAHYIIFIRSLSSNKFNHLINYTINRLFRFLLFIGIWYITQELFDLLLLFTSHCKMDKSMTNGDCHQNNYIWVPGLDISGHIFVILFSNLVLIQESFTIFDWYNNNKINIQIDELLDAEIQTQVKDISETIPPPIDLNNNITKNNINTEDSMNLASTAEENVNTSVIEANLVISVTKFENLVTLSIKCAAFDQLSWSTIFLELVYYASKFVSFVWDYLMLQTILFYHTILEKILAYCVTVFLFKILYGNKTIYTYAALIYKLKKITINIYQVIFARHYFYYKQLLCNTLSKFMNILYC